MKKNIYRIAIICLVLIFACISFSEARTKHKRRAQSAACRAVILSNSTGQKRLYSQNPNGKVLPASLTKIMTALLVMERLTLDQYVTVGPRATYVQPSKIGVVSGEKYKVRDLLYALLLSSANDASIVLAEAVASSESNFVLLMNKRARQLGAKATRFANSNGLPTKRGTQYTTAYDMYLIFREALKYNFFRDTISHRYKIIQSSTGRKITLKNHNKILFGDWGREIYGKTGYTRAAGACFMGAVQKGQDTLIIGVFGCNNRWEVIKRVVTRYGGVLL